MCREKVFMIMFLNETWDYYVGHISNDKSSSVKVFKLKKNLWI